jgi:hypothetical protein
MLSSRGSLGTLPSDHRSSALPWTADPHVQRIWTAHPVTGVASATRAPAAFILLLVLLLVASVLPTTAGASEGGGQPFPPVEDRVPDQVLVRFLDGVPPDAREKVLTNAGAKTLSVIEQLDVHVARVPEHAAERVVAALQRNPMVEYAEFDTVIEIDEVTEVVPNDPEWSRQWGPRKVNAPEAWARSTGHRDVVIAILDTGVAPVEDLRDKLLPGRNVMDGNSDIADELGHGTMSAGVAAASTDNGVGVAGYCWECMILPVKVMENTGTSSDLAAGIVWATDNGADVISMSLSGPSGTSTVHSAVRYAADLDVSLVASAGNNGDSTERYPAAYPEVIAVAGSTSTDEIYVWSNFGSWVDVAAPGQNRTTHRDGSFFFYAGTSSATPAAAGVIGLARSLNVSASEAREALHLAAVPLSDVRFGRIDAHATVELLVSGTSSEPVAEPEPIAEPEPASELDVDPEPEAESGSDPTPEPAPDPPSDDSEPDPETDEPESPADEPEAGGSDPEPHIELSVSTSKTRGLNIATVRWSGTAETTVQLVIDGSGSTIANTGSYRHETGQRGSPAITYQLCDALGCSESVTVSSW